MWFIIKYIYPNQGSFYYSILFQSPSSLKIARIRLYQAPILYPIDIVHIYGILESFFAQIHVIWRRLWCVWLSEEMCLGSRVIWCIFDGASFNWCIFRMVCRSVDGFFDGVFDATWRWIIRLKIPGDYAEISAESISKDQ